MTGAKQNLRLRVSKSIEEQAETAYPDIMGIGQGSYRAAYVNGAKARDAEIAALKSELHELKTKYDFQHLVKENNRLKAENQKLKSEFNEIWTPAFGELKAENNKLQNYIGAKYHACLSELEHLKAENAKLSDMYKEQIEKNYSLKVNSEAKLREQVKDYEVALKECENITFLAADNGNLVHWKPAREVLKKWSEL